AYTYCCQMKVNAAKHKLTTAGDVSPTIYTSCIKQFWTSVKVKTVNDDVRLQALVYGKKVIVNEASIRRDLRLDDAEGTSFSGVITPLLEIMIVQAPEERKHKSKRKQRKETEVPQTEPQVKEHIPTPSYDPLPSGEDRLQLNELMDICTKLSDKDEEGLGAQEDAFKQGRIAKIDAAKNIFLIDETAQDQGRINDQDLFRVHDFDGDEVFVDVTTGENVEQDATVAENVEGIVGFKCYINPILYWCCLAEVDDIQRHEEKALRD
nr:hypothetical protein [Tanacetum cinerariifolium]